jgi:hypothetical protein
MTENTAASAGKYCYSTDEEEYYGEFDSREEALAEARNCKDEGMVWTGVVKPAVDYLRKWHKSTGERIAEALDENLADYISGDEAIFDLAPEKCEELGKLITDFIEQHAVFNRWGVGDIQEHAVGEEA